VKTVGAVFGGRVEVSNAVSVNGLELANSASLSLDRRGRKVRLVCVRSVRDRS
jgi:hypothetical protein